MSLGSVLLQPQALNAAQRALDERAPNAFLDMLTRMVAEIANDGPALKIIEEEFIASLETLVAEVEPRLAAAHTRLEGLIKPMFDLVEDTLGAESDGDGFDRAVATSKKFTDAVATALGGLTSAKLGQVVATLFDAVETDMGLSEARARAFMSGTFERIVNRMQADYVGGSGDAVAYNRFALGAALREVVATAGQQVDLPPLDKATLLPALMERLQDLGMDGRIADAQAATRKVGEGLTALKGVKTLFEAASVDRGPTMLGALDVGAERFSTLADESQHCWYASWLKGTNVSHPSSTSNPDLEGVDFGETLTARTMEDFARVTGVLVSAAEAGLHFYSMEKGDRASNLANAIWHVIEGLIKLFGNVDPPRWLKWVIAGLASILGGFEGARANDLFGAWLVIGDIFETQLFARLVWLTREFWLSAFTLANNSSSKVNHNYFEGVAHQFGEIGNLLMGLILAKTAKRSFGFPAGHGGSWGAVIGFVLAAWAVNFFMTLAVGTLLAMAFAGKAPDTERIFRALLKDRMFARGTGGWLILQTLATFIMHVTDFYVWYWKFADGDTNGGKLTGINKEAFEYPGYPNRENSPYRLPWANGKIYQCAQGNHGLWSHTPYSYEVELYAFDFNFNHGDEVLAIRDGVVWDFLETTPDNTHDMKENHIIILHQDPPLPGHDFDENKAPVRTFSVYLHSAQASITGSFLMPIAKEKGQPPGSGTPVSRGQVIMKANHTGRSAYNHLHLQVRPANAAGEPADYTIPFVFGDEDLERHVGVPRSGRWYDSSNVKVD